MLSQKACVKCWRSKGQEPSEWFYRKWEEGKASCLFKTLSIPVDGPPPSWCFYHLEHVISAGVEVCDELVRDKIPEIIAAAGKRCKVRVLAEEDIGACLLAKLRDEVAELEEAASIEKVADIMEVLGALAERMGSSRDEVESRRKEKRVRRGGFEKGLFLEYVEKATREEKQDAEDTPDRRESRGVCFSLSRVWLRSFVSDKATHGQDGQGSSGVVV